MFIHWDHKLDTGQPLLDAEHRLLVLLFRKLDVAIKTHQSEDTLRRIVLELTRFVEFHFVSEENLMRETGYPGLDDHQTAHTELLLELNAFVAKLASRHEYPEDLLEFRDLWLVGHVATHDQPVAQHALDAVDRPIAELAYAEYLGRAGE